jgi:RNA polymerase sigma-70 factor (ECF subfamily)
MKTIKDYIRGSLVPLYPRLKRFGISLTESEDRAEDLVQHACERALERFDQWVPGTRFDSWLYQIMYNAWIAEQTSEANKASTSLDDAVNVESNQGPAAVESRMMLDDVFKELLHLPEEHRIVLILVCVDGLSYKEAAEVLNIRVGTVMSRVSRGRFALSRRLGQSFPRSGDVMKLR